MEIADVFIVNKADRPGSARLVKEIRQAMHLRAGRTLEDVPAHHGVDLGRAARAELPPEPTATAGWEVPVLTTNALTGEGVPEVIEALDAHRTWLEGSGELSTRRRARSGGRVRDVVEREMRRVAWGSDAVKARLDAGLDRIEAGEGTPYTVAEEILALLLR